MNAKTVLMVALLLVAATATAQLDSLAPSPRDTLPKDTVFLANGDYFVMPALTISESRSPWTFIETTAQYLIQTDTIDQARNWMIEYDKGMDWYRVSTVAEVGPELIRFLSQYPGLEWVEKARRYTVTVEVGKMYSDRSWEIIHNALTEFYNQ